jgi:hypothetical protein
MGILIFLLKAYMVFLMLLLLLYITSGEKFEEAGKTF